MSDSEILMASGQTFLPTPETSLGLAIEEQDLGEGFQLRSQTPVAWAYKVLENFDDFLQDHAACERKATATCMSFVFKYQDRAEFVEIMLRLAREELEHFYMVYRIMRKRGLKLANDQKDPYINELLIPVRGPREERLLDRLLVLSVVEARGCERFGILADVIEDPVLKKFYQDLARAESRHNAQYLRLAEKEIGKAAVLDRMDFWLDFEAELVNRLPFRHALH